MDLQVMMPRTLDAAKIAAVHDQQSLTQQQQLSSRSKKDVDDQQRQVQTMLSATHDGKVTTEDLDQEKQNKRRQHDRGADKEAESTQSGNEKVASHSPDNAVGHKIDIKT